MLSGIVEIFNTIQGEGLQIGRPSTLIRVANCNLHCTWCDTPNRNNINHKITLLDVYELIKANTQDDVVITGGEPLLDQPYLKQIIRQVLKAQLYSHAPIPITIETNCTIQPQKYINRMTPNILWSVSPKLSSSNETYNVNTLIYFSNLKNSQIKFVIKNSQDINDLLLALEYIPLSKEIIVQPVSSPTMTLMDYSFECKKLVSLMSELNIIHKFRILPQFHKIIWGLNTKR